MPKAAITESEKLSDLVSLIHQVQDNYNKTNKRYWQGLRTKSDDTKKASNLESWKELNLSLVDIAEEIAVNVYDGPTGKGYEIVLTAEKNGKLYRKIIAFGSESERSCDWTLYNPNPE